ncbi:alkaline shock protein 23 [Clostridium tepidiprofundi DSM 19306]|uniref:Alkaline shock protein 23 n=1 Tax=Clostridium tepidiprofundi DSM 19306 TaxID=1121338 RepID=A0A151B7B1_9CLOT|nr:Asp23/Gls24 family envelope stress response protein [Clostridium tepidiprofundi]KYH35693.1 alkaline shock protein 23 [Clostridium tepidiprofundi DSM 19306]
MDENVINNSEIGIVKISDDVVSVIARIAADEINGVVGMSSNAVVGFSQMFSSKKNLSKGVKVNVKDDGAEIDLYVVVQYGMKIHEVCAKVQSNVKKAVETMTGLNVLAVNVYVQNVELPKQPKQEETEEAEQES